MIAWVAKIKINQLQIYFFSNGKEKRPKVMTNVDNLRFEQYFVHKIAILTS
jgi:hypothetical protein